MSSDTPDSVRAFSALAGSGDAVCLSSSSAADVQTNSPPRANAQIKFQDPHKAEAEIAAGITCASMCADELRGCLVREIFRAALIDDVALANLRRHWLVTRASIAPLAGELRDLTGGRP